MQERDELYKAILNHYGIEKQENMLLEEMAELQIALLHQRRGRPNNIMEEIADVQIMLEQIQVYYTLNVQSGEMTIEEHVQRKLKKMTDKLSNEPGNFICE